MNVLFKSNSSQTYTLRQAIATRLCHSQKEPSCSHDCHLHRWQETKADAKKEFEVFQSSPLHALLAHKIPAGYSAVSEGIGLPASFFIGLIFAWILPASVGFFCAFKTMSKNRRVV